MGNKRNERWRRKKQADLDEILEIEGRVDNLLMECYAEIIDDILPVEYERNHVCEHYRGRYREENYWNSRDFEQMSEQILTAIVIYILPFFYLLVLIAIMEML